MSVKFQPLSDGRFAVSIQGVLAGSLSERCGDWVFKPRSIVLMYEADELESIAAKLRELNKGAKTE